MQSVALIGALRHAASGSSAKRPAPRAPIRSGAKSTVQARSFTATLSGGVRVKTHSKLAPLRDRRATRIGRLFATAEGERPLSCGNCLAGELAQNGKHLAIRKKGAGLSLKPLPEPGILTGLSQRL